MPGLEVAVVVLCGCVYIIDGKHKSFIQGWEAASNYHILRQEYFYLWFCGSQEKWTAYVWFFEIVFLLEMYFEGKTVVL